MKLLEGTFQTQCSGLPVCLFTTDLCDTLLRSARSEADCGKSDSGYARLPSGGAGQHPDVLKTGAGPNRRT